MLHELVSPLTLYKCGSSVFILSEGGEVDFTPNKFLTPRRAEKRVYGRGG